MIDFSKDCFLKRKKNKQNFQKFKKTKGCLKQLLLRVSGEQKSITVTQKAEREGRQNIAFFGNRSCRPANEYVTCSFEHRKHRHGESVMF